MNRYFRNIKKLLKFFFFKKKTSQMLLKKKKKTLKVFLLSFKRAFQNITKHIFFFFVIKTLKNVFRPKNTINTHYQTGLKPNKKPIINTSYRNT